MLRTTVVHQGKVAAFGVVAIAACAGAAAAQPLGAFGWQLQPFCNRVTATVTQTGTVYTLDGYDDQCGAAQRAPLVGVATPNPDGTIGLGLSIVTVPGGRPVHVDARISLPSVSGSWTDSAGNAGTFLFGGNGAGAPRPAPSSTATPASVGAAALVPGAVTSVAIADGSVGTADIDSAQVQRRIDLTCPGGSFFIGVNADGSPVCSAGAAAENTALGGSALASNTTGSVNVAIGFQALAANTTGESNVAGGRSALTTNTSGNRNVAFGRFTLGSNRVGSLNVGLGTNALLFNVAGGGNVAVGDSALYNANGNDNVAIGRAAGASLTTGSNNVHIAHQGFTDDTAAIRIGTAGTQTRAFVAGVRGVTTATAAIPVLVGTDGQLGTTSSSRRVKDDITDMGAASAAIFRLRPVTFRYAQAQSDGSRPLDYGLIAEEVAEAFPALAVYGQDGRPETVAYHKLPALLVNELQKLARVVEAQRGELAALRAALSALRH